MRLTWLRLRPLMPRASTRSSTRRVETGFLDHRQQGPLSPSPWLQQAGEVAAVTDARDGETDAAHARVPASFPVAVALGAAVLGVTHPVGHPGEPGDLGFHHRLREHLHALAQEVGITIGAGLAHRLEQAHPVLGHRGPPSS